VYLICQLSVRESLAKCSVAFLFIFVFKGYAYHQHLHSFPTRRSSDLNQTEVIASQSGDVCVTIIFMQIVYQLTSCLSLLTNIARSEEHTSELQSQSNLVCRLLLEKKKTHAIRIYAHSLNHTLHRMPHT